MKRVTTIPVNYIAVVVAIVRERRRTEGASHGGRDIHHGEEASMEGVERFWMVMGLVFGHREVHDRSVSWGGAQDPRCGTRGER